MSLTDSPLVGQTRPSLDQARLDYAMNKARSGFPLSSIARMIGVCADDLRARLEPVEVRIRPPPPSDLPEIFDMMIAAVSADWGIDVARLRNIQDRAKRVTHARQDLLWRLVQLKNDRGEQRLSANNIARRLGYADHTSVTHGVGAHEARLAAQ